MLSLLEIQKLQFGDKARAEKELGDFFVANYAQSIENVQINTKPESLNSLNGIVTFSGGDRFFFKTHVEENEQLAEYYNSGLLQEAGYPVLRPRKLETHPGQQLALYEIVTLPTLFDEVKACEDKCLDDAVPMNPAAETLVALNAELDNMVFDCHKRSLDIEKKPTANAPIHQLFGHRLADEGRIDIFYKDKSIPVGQRNFSFEELSRLKWTINGTTYNDSLGQAIARAKLLMSLDRAVTSVIGHGDAHNGNVFVDYDAKKLLYFDPAFAGRHDPLLDLTKPIFHNVFARWMYFPEQVNSEFELTTEISNSEIRVEHNYEPTQIRKEILNSKLRYALKPLLQHLRQAGLLAPDWQQYLRSALLCCPLLTVNLFAEPNLRGTLSEKYSTKIKLLGLVMTMTAGSSAIKVNESDTLHGMIAQIFEL